MTETAKNIASEYLKTVDQDYYIKTKVEELIKAQLAIELAPAKIDQKIKDKLTVVFQKYLAINKNKVSPKFTKEVIGRFENIVEDDLRYTYEWGMWDIRDFSCYDNLYDKICSGLIKEMNRRLKLVQI